MENKILVKLIVPELDSEFDVFIPVNELIWRVKSIFIKCVSDISNISLDSERMYVLINKDNNTVYTNNEIVINTDIRNGTELILISNNKEG